MKAIQVKQYGGYDQLQVVELPQPTATDGAALVKLTAAAINGTDETIRAGHLPAAKALPLVLGNEGVGVIVEQGASPYPPGTRVMVTGVYGVFRDGTWTDYLAVQPQDLYAVPDTLSDAEAAGLLVPYLTAYFALTAAGFKADQVVLAPAVGGAVGNATVQLARAMGAGRVLSTASTTAKTEQARAAGYENVIDLSRETLTTGVKRLTGGAGANVAIDSVGGPVTSQVLASLARGGALIVLGYPAGTRTTIEVTDLIWKRAHMQGFSLFAYTPEQLAAAYDTTLRPLLSEGRIRPAVARTFPLEAASEAQRYLNESRPFGRVVLTL